MTSQAWKAIERTVASLAGGTRSWNSEDDIDVLTDTYAIEVKHRQAITIAQVEAWLRHNKPKAAARGLKNAVVVKRKAGRGTPTPYIACFELEPPEGVPMVVVEATSAFVDKYSEALDKLS